MKSKFTGYAFIGAICIIIGVVIFKFLQEPDSDVNKDESISFKNYKGQVYGTYFSVEYASTISYKAEIDSIFNQIDQAASAYLDNSEISQLNAKRRLDSTSVLLQQHFNVAKELHQYTKGYFEPTLSPVIDLWGFGRKKSSQIDSTQVKEAMKQVGFPDSYTILEHSIQLKPQRHINFTAMGEGFAIKEISDFLISKSIQRFKVEIGGELQTKGLSPRDKPWLIGIESPLNEENNTRTNYLARVELVDQALSTSGSYRKFYVDENGVKRSHIIDPKTGYPVTHDLVSVSILANDAITADAVATAVMAMGFEDGKDFIEAKTDLEAFLIVNTTDGIDYWRSSDSFMTEF